MLQTIIHKVRKNSYFNSLIGVISLLLKHRGHYGYANVIDLETAKNNRVAKFTRITGEQVVKICGPTYYLNHRIEKHTEKEDKIDATYMIYIKNGIISGSSNTIILDKNNIIYNHISGPNVNYTDDIFCDYRKVYSIGPKTRYYTGNNDLLTVESAISFCINYNYNYYHYVFECLSKFYILEQTNLDKSIPIIIDSTAREIPQFEELLQIFNSERRQVIYLERRQQIVISNLIAFTPTLYIPANFKDYTNIKANWIKFNPSIIDYLRNTILKKYIIPNNDTKRIYISRNGNKLRSYNDIQIKTMTESIGFKTIFPERYTIEEQVLTFNNANYIIAASGAALTNIIFCRPNTTVIVLSNQKIDISIFSSIAEYLDLRMIYIVADKSNSKSLHSDFYFNPLILKNSIESIIANYDK